MVSPIHMPDAPHQRPFVTDGPSFASTDWSMVLAAGDPTSPKAASALEKLCRTYWHPLYFYIRRRGYNEEDAKDATQGFFVKLLVQHGFSGLMPGSTKFRSFLLVALKNYLATAIAREKAIKRGEGELPISLDAQSAEQGYKAIEPHHFETPEKLFERRWAITLLEEALAQLQKEFADDGRTDLFNHLRDSLLERSGGESYAKVAAKTGLTEEAIKKIVQRMRRRYREIIRKLIGKTVVTASEIGEEMDHLGAALRS